MLLIHFQVKAVEEDYYKVQYTEYSTLKRPAKENMSGQKKYQKRTCNSSILAILGEPTREYQRHLYLQFDANEIKAANDRLKTM